MDVMPMSRRGKKTLPQRANTNEIGSVYVPVVVGLNFQLTRTNRAAALANMGGPEVASAPTTFPF